MYNTPPRAKMPVMARLTDITSYADAQAEFSPAKLWELFDGDREHLNIAHECIDRHASRANPAVIVVRLRRIMIAAPRRSIFASKSMEEPICCP